MTNTKKLSASLGMMLVAGIFASIPTASADVIIMQPAPMVMAPTKVLMPPQSHVILRQPTQVFRQSYITTPPQVEVMTRSAVIAPAPVVERTVTQQLLISPTLGSMSNYRARLDNISDQIALGTARGWLDSASAASLQSEYQSLASIADDIMARGGGTLGESGMLEQRINVLNQKVANMMRSLAI